MLHLLALKTGIYFNFFFLFQQKREDKRPWLVGDLSPLKNIQKIFVFNRVHGYVCICNNLAFLFYLAQ